MQLRRKAVLKMIRDSENGLSIKEIGSEAGVTHSDNKRIREYTSSLVKQGKVAQQGNVYRSTASAFAEKRFGLSIMIMMSSHNL